MIPYAQLPEFEKQYDRIMAEETLNFFVALGYKIKNKMKSGLILYLIVFSPLLVRAQTQHEQRGYVKTKGRLDNNGSVIAGTRLSGATVTIKGGNDVVSGKKGTFTLAITGNNFFLQNVEKSGYIPIDPEMLNKQYAYSKDPLVLVMETPDNKYDEKWETERKLRRTLEQNLEQSRREIRELKEQNKLTQEEYERKLRELSEKQENEYNMVSEMADRFTKIDFDELSEFNCRVSQLILEGKLTEADSLINTKGDISTRTADFRQLQKRNVKDETKKTNLLTELSILMKDLTKNKRKERELLNDLAEDCYHKFEIYKLRHMNDSATYYLECRAQLDTTNIEWQNDAGEYICAYLANYPKALSYYECVLRQSIEQEGAESLRIAEAYNNIGYIYSCQGHEVKALEFYDKALGIQERDSALDNPSIASTYSNIGVIYYKQADYSKAMEYFEKALGVWKDVSGKENPDIASLYNNIASVYDSQGNFSKSLEFYTKALDIRVNVYGIEHPFVAQSYNNIGSVYNRQHNYTKALECFRMA